MPAAIALPIRTYIVEQHQQGHPLSQIAAELQLSYWSVRRLWRCYRDAGMTGLSLGYCRCGRRGVRSERLLYRSAVWLKRHHPGWGAGLIQALLSQRYPQFSLPHRRTLQRWWVQAGVQTSSPHRLRSPAMPPQHPQQVHQVWQLDATSHARLADGSGASWLSVVDEYSGALLESAVFPPLRL